MNFIPGQNGVYLIAEIGGNHEGNFELAKLQCELAIDSGADCIKFQLYSAEGLVNEAISPDRYAHFKKFELTPDQHIELAKICKDAGRDYLASVWEVPMLEWIDPYLNAYKIGSGDLTALPMLRVLAKRGKPIILSTGLSNFDEIAWAVGEIRKTNDIYYKQDMITILQCTSMYPIPNEDANLLVIRSLAEIPNVQVGYSDHTQGLEALVYSIAVGAKVLEFHFTDERNGRDFRDHKVSLLKDEVLELRKRCEEVSVFLGSKIKKPLQIEVSTDHVISFRRALYPSRDLDKGVVISERDLVALRPCKGIGAQHLDQVVGQKLKVSLKKGELLQWDILEENHESVSTC